MTNSTDSPKPVVSAAEKPVVSAAEPAKKKPGKLMRWMMKQNLFLYLVALRAVPWPKAVAPATPGAPLRPYRVEINTGAGMRKVDVQATNQREAHYTALAKYMQTYFKTRVYPLPYKETGNASKGAQ